MAAWAAIWSLKTAHVLAKAVPLSGQVPVGQLYPYP